MSVTDLPDYTGYSSIENVYGDVKIYTPSGLWVTFSQLLTGSTYVYGVSIAAGNETELVSLSGRGRIKQIGFYFSRTGTGTDVYNDLHIRIYVDGETSPSIDLRAAEADRLNGYVAMTNIIYGINRVSYGTDEYVTTVQAVSPGGAVTSLRYDSGDSEAVFVGGYIRPEAEFTSSASIRVYNAGSVGAYAYVVVTYGEYL